MYKVVSISAYIHPVKHAHSTILATGGIAFWVVVHLATESMRRAVGVLPALNRRIASLNKNK